MGKQPEVLLRTANLTLADWLHLIGPERMKSACLTSKCLGHPARDHWKGKMPSAEIMDHIPWKAELDCIAPRVPSNRQLIMSLSFCGGLRAFIQGPYGMKVRNWMTTL